MPTEVRIFPSQISSAQIDANEALARTEAQADAQGLLDQMLTLAELGQIQYIADTRIVRWLTDDNLRTFRTYQADVRFKQVDFEEFSFQVSPISDVEEPNDEMNQMVLTIIHLANTSHQAA